MWTLTQLETENGAEAKVLSYPDKKSALRNVFFKDGKRYHKDDIENAKDGDIIYKTWTRSYVRKDELIASYDSEGPTSSNSRYRKCYYNIYTPWVLKLEEE